MNRRRPRTLALLSACLAPAAVVSLQARPLAYTSQSPWLKKQAPQPVPSFISRHQTAVQQHTPHRLLQSPGVNNNNNYYLSPTALSMSAATRKPLISVSIDQSLLPDHLYTHVKKPRSFGGMSQVVAKFLAVLSTSSVLKIAILSFAGALLVTFLAQSKGLSSALRYMNARLQPMVERFQPAAPEGIPMPFDPTENDGWGVCTLRSKRRLGKTSFFQYDFELPEPDYILPLDLGQMVSMCCLDNDGNVGRGDFFEHNKATKAKPGAFSIIAPNRSAAANAYAVGEDTANFIRILKQDIRVGDEIAVKPGDRRLSYRGQYLPVTDMLYIASGVGIVPVLEQVRTVLPKGSSTVASVTVLWVNDNTKDFDVLSELLEKEYFKYSTKLAVSCVVDDLRINSMADNQEIQDALPEFVPGTMAVLAGPQEIMRKARGFLKELGYPDDTICVL